jgi:hypothetical protein
MAVSSTGSQQAEGNSCIGAIRQTVDAQTLVNAHVRIRCYFPEPRGASIVEFTNLDEAILANSGS